MVRKGNDGNDYQGVKYKVSNTAKKEEPVAAPAQTPVATAEEEVNPFESADFAEDATDVEVPW